MKHARHIKTPPAPTATWLRALLNRHMITQCEAAELLHIKLRTFQAWVGDPDSPNARNCPWMAAELLRRLLAEQDTTTDL